MKGGTLLLARLIPHKEIIKNNINDYLEKTTGFYSRFQQTPPTFVTYYSQDRLTSTYDVGLENVIEVVGRESPIKYNKITDFALYGIETGTLQTELGDFGMDTNFEGDALVLPNTIRPYPDDLFSIYYNGEEIMFRVTNVEIDKLSDSNAKYYRITYELAREKKDLISDQIQEDYEMFYENLGTEEAVVVKKSSARLIKNIDILEERLIKFYGKAFYNERFGIISYRYHDRNLYNSYLIKFLADNELLERKHSYLSTIFIYDIFDDDAIFEELYERTLYWALENKDIDRLEVESFYTMVLDNPSTPFYGHYEKFYKCKYESREFLPSGMTEVIRPHMDLLIENIRNNELFMIPHVPSIKHLNDINEEINEDEITLIEHPDYVYENIIIKYMNNDLILDDNFINYLTKINFRPFLKEFLLVPCILFILKDFKNSLLVGTI